MTDINSTTYSILLRTYKNNISHLSTCVTPESLKFEYEFKNTYEGSVGAFLKLS